MAICSLLASTSIVALRDLLLCLLESIGGELFDPRQIDCIGVPLLLSAAR